MEPIDGRMIANRKDGSSQELVFQILQRGLPLTRQCTAGRVPPNVRVLHGYPSRSCRFGGHAVPTS